MSMYIPYIVDLFILCRYQGHVSAALVLGGYDVTGPHLHTVSFVCSMALVFSFVLCYLRSSFL